MTTFIMMTDVEAQVLPNYDAAAATVAQAALLGADTSETYAIIERGCIRGVGGWAVPDPEKS